MGRDGGVVCDGGAQLVVIGRGGVRECGCDVS